MTNGEARHFVRFGGHNEQAYFTGDLADTYEGLVFNGNLVAWSAAGIAGFVCEQNLVQKSFFIDPLTHAFQHDPSALTHTKDEKEEVKPSIQRLIEAYGDPVQSLAGTAALVPDDLQDLDLCRAFAQRVLDFQRTKVHAEATNTDAWDILQFKYGSNLHLRPSILVPPYFYMRKATFNDWIEQNIKFAQLGSELAGDIPVAVQIVVAPDVVTDKDTRNQLIERYSELEAERLLFWIDDFSEHEASEDELLCLRRLWEGWAEGDKLVLNLYGGFYSILLSKAGTGPLAGVCHGPQYGEDRSVTPVGGGLPTARFYLFPLHNRVRFADALRLLRKQGWLDSREAYFDNVCSCPQCRRLIDEHGVEKGFLMYGEGKDVTFQRGGTTVSMRYPLRETQVAATAHYMYSKRREFQVVASKNAEDILEHLNRVHSEFRRFLGDSVAYLGNWERALRA